MSAVKAADPVLIVASDVTMADKGAVGAAVAHTQAVEMINHVSQPFMLACAAWVDGVHVITYETVIATLCAKLHAH